MKVRTILLLLALLCWQTGCSKPSDHGHDHDHGEHAGHDHGDHGHDHGADHAPGLLEIGDHVGHIDFQHDAAAGTATLTVTGPDAKTPLVADSAPKINIIGDNPLQIETAAQDGASGVYTATHEALKGEPEGRIAIVIAGQSYQISIEHHDHDH
jgi:hypothetical protein